MARCKFQGKPPSLSRLQSVGVPEFSGLVALKEQRRLFVIVNGDEIIVTVGAFVPFIAEGP